MWFKYGLKAQKLQKQHALKVQKLQKQHALKGQKLLAQGIALGIMAINKAPCKGKSFTISRSPPNPGIRNSHHIPHYIIARTLYIPLQTNALCDALSDWQCIVMFYPQLIG